MQKYREQTERFSRENRGFGVRRRNNLKIKNSQTRGGREESLGVNVTISMSESDGEENCT